MYVVVGCMGCRLCTVRALLEYMETRGTSPGPFFMDYLQCPVCKPWFVGR